MPTPPDELLDEGSASPTIPAEGLPTFYRLTAARLRRDAADPRHAPEAREQILKSARNFDDLAESVERPSP
jgi:hypothetical protein